MQNILTHIVSNINLIWYILLFPFIFIWIRSILFVTRDISHRTDSLIYQIFCILLSSIPIVGFMLYFIFRPIRLTDDIIWRKSINTLAIQCNECWEFNNRNNIYCTSCWEKLTITCKECSKQYYNWYDYCPYCWAPNLELE